jgi:hypothetical protein
MPTVNYDIGPQDGWVQVADAPDFVRTSGQPHSHPYYVYAGSAAPSLTAAAATGEVIFAGLPDPDDTITIGSEVYTLVAAAADPFEVTIGATADETGANLVSTITANSTLVTASNSSGTVTLTAIAVGTQGNYDLSEDAANTTVSGAALTGGAEIVDGVLVCHHPFEVNVTMTEKLFVRTPNPVNSARRNDGRLRLDVFTVE